MSRGNDAPKRDAATEQRLTVWARHNATRRPCPRCSLPVADMARHLSVVHSEDDD